MRPLLPITTAVFALTSVVHGGIFDWKKPRDVQAEARFDLIPYDTLDCSGKPQQAPLQITNNNMCFNFLETRSLMPVFTKGHHAGWIDEVNKLRMHCKLQTFGQYHCPEKNRTVEYRHGTIDVSPQSINKCLVPAREKYEDDEGTDDEDVDEDDYAISHAIRAAMFICGPVETPIAQKEIYSATPSATSHTKEGAQQTKIAARGAAIGAGGDSKGVWMMHPWNFSTMCFLCYTKKNNYSNIECRGGARHEADCGPLPTAMMNGNPVHHSTVTSTVTAVSTSHTTRTKKSIAFKETTSTVTDGSFGNDQSDEGLSDLKIEHQQKRSWHTPVKFPHPFIIGKNACADAEWEKRGQGSKSYVKIQHVHFCDNKDRHDSLWLGFPSTVIHTSTITKISSLIVDHTSTLTSTALVAKTTTVKHDQL